jgi:plasmid stability protein
VAAARLAEAIETFANTAADHAHSVKASVREIWSERRDTEGRRNRDDVGDNVVRFNRAMT